MNNLFRGQGKRRFKTKQYREWLAKSIPLLAMLRPATAFPVGITVLVVGKMNVQRDLDNLLKPIGDALVEAKIIPGDDIRRVNRWDVRHEAGPEAAVVYVRVEP